MSDGRRPEWGENGENENGPGDAKPARNRTRDRWIGAGIFIPIAIGIALLAVIAASIEPALASIGALIGAGAAIYWLQQKNRDMLIGCMLAFAVTLVVGGGACIALIISFSRSY